MQAIDVINFASLGITLFISISTFLIGRRTAKRTEGRASGVLASDLRYLKAGVDNIRYKQEEQEDKGEQRHLEVMTRLAGVEESVRSAHKRIDRMPGTA